jgi:hypothetical protein
MESEEQFTAAVGRKRGALASATTSTSGELSQEIAPPMAGAPTPVDRRLNEREDFELPPLPFFAARLLSWARYAVMTALVVALGAAAAGGLLIVEGITRKNNTFVALGVVCVLVTLLASGAGAWRLAGPGIEVERQAIIGGVVAKSSSGSSTGLSAADAGTDSQEPHRQLPSSSERPPP